MVRKQLNFSHELKTVDVFDDVYVFKNEVFL